MAGGAVRMPTRLYPDLEQFFAEGVLETSSTYNDLTLPYRPTGQQGRGQGQEWQFQGLEPTAPPPSEYGLDLYQNLERLQLDLDSLALVAPEEPALDYTFDLEPDYDFEEEEEEKKANLRHNDRNELERRDRAVSRSRISDLKLSLSNLNLNEAEKKLLRDKRIEVPPCRPPAPAARDFAAWMTWRLQANKLLAALILIRSGRRVQLRHSEVYRKPLSLQNVHGIVRDARGGDREKRRVEETSLTGCPYIMYGIPRVRLPHKQPAAAAASAAVAAPKTKR